MPGTARSKNENSNNDKPLNFNTNKNKHSRTNLRIIKRSNNICQALVLPTICNINPRSVYNKIDEFHEFVKQEEVSLVLMSES